MPQVTTAQRHKVNRDPITDAHVMLLEFQEDGAAKIERAAINNEDVTFEGNVFTRANIEAHAPSSGDGEQSASLTISNIDRIVGQIIDGCRYRINVRMIVIDVANPDAPLIDTKNLMVMPTASGDSETITATLGPRMDLQEPVPFQRTTRNFFPGTFAA